MDFTTTMNVSERDDLITAYNSNILEHFDVKMTDIIYPKVKEMTTSIVQIREHYQGNHNIAYIDQVMQDSVKVIKNNPKNTYSLNLFINDINFSIDSAHKIVINNFEHIDILANHLVDLANIEEMVYFILDYINNYPNRIEIDSTLSLEELIMSLMQLKAVLKKHLYQISEMQNYALNIINKVGIMRTSLLNSPGDIEDDEED